MQTYQVKILPRNTFLFGGEGMTASNAAEGAFLLIKNDRFGEPVSLRVVSQEPTQPATTTDFGILGPDQAFSLNLKFVLRVEARTLAHNLDSVVSCCIEMRG